MTRALRLRGAGGMEMAMTLPERIEAIERTRPAAHARGMRAFAVSRKFRSSRAERRA